MPALSSSKSAITIWGALACAMNFAFTCMSDSLLERFSVKGYAIMYEIFIGIIFPIFISEAAFYSSFVNNDLTGYNCSDTIINEVIRIGIETSIKNIPYIKKSFYLE